MYKDTRNWHKEVNDYCLEEDLAIIIYKEHKNLIGF